MSDNHKDSVSLSKNYGKIKVKEMSHSVVFMLQ